MDQKNKFKCYVRGPGNHEFKQAAKADRPISFEVLGLSEPRVIDVILTEYAQSEEGIWVGKGYSTLLGSHYLVIIIKYIGRLSLGVLKLESFPTLDDVFAALDLKKEKEGNDGS